MGTTFDVSYAVCYKKLWLSPKIRAFPTGTLPQTPHTHTHTHTCLTVLFPGLPGWAGTRKVKPIWILLKQETLSGNGISWAICKSASRSRQITMPVPHHSFFTGRMPFLPPNQQRQSTEGKLSQTPDLENFAMVYWSSKSANNLAQQITQQRWTLTAW